MAPDVGIGLNLAEQLPTDKVALLPKLLAKGIKGKKTTLIASIKVKR